MTTARKLRIAPTPSPATQKSTLRVRADVQARPEADLANQLLTTREAAAYTPYTPHGLENLRCAGKGPAFIKIHSGAVAYRLADLLAWQDQHRISTLDQE